MQAPEKPQEPTKPDGRARHGAKKLNHALRRQQAVTMRLAAATYQQIGDALGISPQAAYKLVRKAYAEAKAKTAEDASEAKAIELDRLDRAQAAIWRQVTQGNLQAIDRFLKISARRSELIGINAPTKIAPTDPTGEHEHQAGIALLPPAITDEAAWLKFCENQAQLQAELKRKAEATGEPGE